MPPKNQIKLTSNFHAAKKAGNDAIEDLINKATDEMHDKAQLRLQQGAEKRGYDLDPGDIEKETFGKDGKITFKQWWGRFFEYGTIYIQAVSFMRPGHRAGRKYIKDKAPDIFEGWFRRKASVRR